MSAKHPKQPDHPEHSEHKSWEEEPELSQSDKWLSSLRPFSMRRKIVAMGVAYFTLFFLICSVIAPTVIDHLATLNLINTGTGQDQNPNNTTNLTPISEVSLAEVDFRSLDDLESMDSHWYWYQGGTGTRNLGGDGVYLNLTKDSSQDLHSHVILGDYQGGRDPGKGNPWLYASMEVRLRTSSDEEGTMFWGFADEFYNPFANCLFFMSNPPQSEPEFTGFMAAAKIGGNDTIRLHKIEGIDPTPWHNYTILWTEQNATWLVDDDVVWQILEAPPDPMSVRIEIMNERYVKSGEIGIFNYGKDVWGLPIDLEQDIQLEIEKLQVFTDKEEVEKRAGEMEEDLATAKSLIQTAGERGMNTTRMWSEYTDAQQDLESKGLIHAELHLRITHINEHLDEVSRLYAQAKELIEKKKQDDPQDRNLIILESRLDSAQRAWDGDSYTLAISHLENILATQT